MSCSARLHCLSALVRVAGDLCLHSPWTPTGLQFGLQLDSDCRHKSRALHKKLLICEIKSHLPRCNQHKHCVCTARPLATSAATTAAATKKKLLLFGIRQIWMPSSQAKSKCNSCSPFSCFLFVSFFIYCIFSLAVCKSMSKSESVWKFFSCCKVFNSLLALSLICCSKVRLFVANTL